VGRGRTFFLLSLCLSFAVAAPALAVDCVQYVRSSSNFDLSGNAWTWWYHAAGVYDRGNVPQAGAVLVFERTRRMPGGHVALVSQVIDDDAILIDHANWSATGGGDGHIRRGVPAVDCSLHHDWSAVCVWNTEFHSFGRPYATSGFIYPDDAGPIQIGSISPPPRATTPR
jgi:CHAP domain-containing protein